MYKETKEHITLALMILFFTAFIVLSATGVIDIAGSGNLAFAALMVPGAAGGKHVVDGPLTTSLTRSASPDLLRNEIDERITRIRPSATPIDQITRLAGSRLSGAMIVDYYSVDTKPVKAHIIESISPANYTRTGNNAYYEIKTDNNSIFEPTETLLLPEYPGYNENNEVDKNSATVLYVLERTDRAIKVIVVNGLKSTTGGLDIRKMPEIDVSEEGAKPTIIRMARAASELDVQTAQYNALPVKATNFCQIFKTQVEESTYQKIANKEVGWTFSDQEEVAISDLRAAIERNYLFGSKARLTDPQKNEEVFLTGGIWNQAGKDFVYKDDTPDTDLIVGLSRTAFTGNVGSKRKVLVAGSDLIERLNKMEYNHVITATDTVTHWGIDFKEIRSKFGALYVVHSEIFDTCSHAADGLIIDPEYLTKYAHVPFRTERIDLKSSGVRNTEAVVATEASCLVLRYPDAHVRVRFENEADTADTSAEE